MTFLAMNQRLCTFCQSRSWSRLFLSATLKRFRNTRAKVLGFEKFKTDQNLGFIGVCISFDGVCIMKQKPRHGPCIGFSTLAEL